MNIRSEEPKDIDLIVQIIQEAFKSMPYGDGTEHLIVNALRSCGALTVSLVAESNGKVVGHIAFSPVTINEREQLWFGLGPIAVYPEYQRQRIGSKLIQSGLVKIRELGAKGCVVLGNPKYYNRFGFKANPKLVFKGGPAENFMLQTFCKEIPEGEVKFHETFSISL